MIWTVAKKEFLEKILDFRVIVSFVIALALAVVATLVAGGDYQAKKIEYDRQVAQEQSLLQSVKVYSLYKPAVYFPPSPLSVFCQGIGIPTPIRVDIEIPEVPRYQPRAAGLNPMMSMFDTLDIATVVRVLFSLLVILLTFDSFSGEKERGTLRLALSNPITRMKLLAGKFLGTIMILGVVVCLTYLIATIMIRLATGIPLAEGYYVRVLLMAVATVLYLGLFAALGMYGSIAFHHSSTSLAVLLFVWFFIAILQPNLNTYIASESEGSGWLQQAQAAMGDNECKAMQDLTRLMQERGSIIDDTSKHRYSHMELSYGDVVMLLSVSDADYDLLEYTMDQVRLYRKLGDCADRDYARYWSFTIDHLNRQLTWKRRLELISPAALFTHGAAILSRTDIDNIDNFFDQARQYRNNYLLYLDQKGIFSTNAHLFFTRLPKEEIERGATERRMARYRNNPGSVPDIDKMDPLDLRDAPVFSGQQSDLASDSGRAAENLLPLLVYLVLVFFLAGRSIRSYDPR